MSADVIFCTVLYSSFADTLAHISATRALVLSASSSCPVCGASVGVSSASLGVHMRSKHPGVATTPTGAGAGGAAAAAAPSAAAAAAAASVKSAV